jgi:hypothetical protein
MIDKFSLRTQYRLGLWALLSGLTLLIFLYPAHLVNKSLPVESMYVFDNLPLFAAMFLIWFAILLTLVLSHGREKTENIEKAALVDKMSSDETFVNPTVLPQMVVREILM